ncbi:unnamed protein product [Rotaria socialis]
MAEAANSQPEKKAGIIILGNAGSGKSFLCNVLIGTDRFKSNFDPGAVTTETEHQRVKIHGKYLYIFNIPGLIDLNDDRIKQNKEEIEKAFKACPNSLVLYVWSHVGGRCQRDDVIAFKALYEAYKFPKDSLAFVVNNLDPIRPEGYDEKFMVTLKVALAPQTFPASDFVFIEKIEPNNPETQEKIKDARLTLMQLIIGHQIAHQTEYGKIDLESKEIKKIRDEFKEKQDALLQDQKALTTKMNEMKIILKKREEEANQRIEQLQTELAIREEKTNRHIDRLTAQLKDKETEMTMNLKERDERTNKQIQELKTKLQAKEEQRRKDLKDHEEKTNRQIDRLNRELKGKEAEMKMDFEKRQENTNRQIEKLNKMLAEKEAERKNDLRMHAANTNERIQQLQAQLAEKRSRHTDTDSSDTDTSSSDTDTSSSDTDTSSSDTDTSSSDTDTSSSDTDTSSSDTDTSSSEDERSHATTRRKTPEADSLLKVLGDNLVSVTIPLAKKLFIG